MAIGRLTVYNTFRGCYNAVFNEFYDRLKNKKTRVVERFLHMIEPKGFLDRICFALDAERTAKYDVAKEFLRRKEELKDLLDLCGRG